MKPELTLDESAELRRSYYAEARSWSSDKVDDMQRSRRTAWIVAGAAISVAVIEAIAMIAMLPLKTVVPYTILVDRNTGFAQVLEGSDVPAVKPQSALVQSLLAQYVVARETYDIASIQSQYRKVALWSEGETRRQYVGIMASGNPQSPVARYGRNTIIETHVESVTPTAKDTALVRFYTERRNQGQAASERAYWVSLIRYRFDGEPLAIEDRFDNPLGFQVVHYRRDQEAPPPVDSGTPSAATGSLSEAAVGRAAGGGASWSRR